MQVYRFDAARPESSRRIARDVNEDARDIARADFCNNICQDRRNAVQQMSTGLRSYFGSLVSCRRSRGGVP
jgi:hypothetical protein